MVTGNRRARLAAFFVAALLLASSPLGCSVGGGSKPAGTSRPAITGAIRTSALPEWAVAACTSIPDLQPFCVDRQPAAHTSVWFMELSRASERYPFNYVVLQQGLGRGVATGILPPRFMMIVEASGPAGAAARRFGLSPAVQRPVSAWPGVGEAKALDAGNRHWGRLHGRLFLTRSAAPGEFRNLAAFTWLDGSERRMIAIGAWSPPEQAVATLRTIVSDLPSGPRATEELVPGKPVAGIPMVRTPEWVWLLCRAETPSGCPTQLPRPRTSFAIVQVSPAGATGNKAAGRADAIDIAWGGASDSPHANRPPRLVHLTVSDAKHQGSITKPRHVNTASLLKHSYPRAPIVLGHPHWTEGPRGTLSLGDSYCFLDHACYRWTDGRLHYQISMHAWDPLPQTLAVFADVVRSIPRH